MKAKWMTSLAVFWTCTAASAQYRGGWEIRVSNTVSPMMPRATIEVWAWYARDPLTFNVAFGHGNFDFLASEPLLHDPRSHFQFPRYALGLPGVPLGGRVVGIEARQWLATGGFSPDPTNPIRVWSCTWTTSEFRPRRIDLRTANTTIFSLYGVREPIIIGLNDPIPGEGSITVVPVPATGALLLGFMHLSRRTRCLRGT